MDKNNVLKKITCYKDAKYVIDNDILFSDAEFKEAVDFIANN